MPLAFVLITTAPGKEAEIYKKVRDCPNVSYVYPLFGEYDLIAKVIIDKNHPYEVSEPWRADSIGTSGINNLGQLVVEQIRSINDVKDTKTLISVMS